MHSSAIDGGRVTRVMLLLCSLFLTRASHAESYGYDNAGRLVSVDYDDGSTVRFTYDSAGNLTAQTTTAPPRNPNAPPDGTIAAPAGDVVVAHGETLALRGQGTDADGPFPLMPVWDLGGAGANLAGTDVVTAPLTTPGTFTVRLVVEDAFGVPDPTPPSFQLTVGAAPDAGPVDSGARSPDAAIAPDASVDDASTADAAPGQADAAGMVDAAFVLGDAGVPREDAGAPPDAAAPDAADGGDAGRSQPAVDAGVTPDAAGPRQDPPKSDTCSCGSSSTDRGLPLGGALLLVAMRFARRLRRHRGHAPVAATTLCLAALLAPDANAQITLTPLVKAGDPAPGISGYVFDTIAEQRAAKPYHADAFIHALGATAFAATVKIPGGTAYLRSVWTVRDGSPELCALEGTQAPGAPSGAMFRTMHITGINMHGEALVAATITGGSLPGTASGWWVCDRNGSLRGIAYQGMPLPGATTVACGSWPSSTPQAFLAEDGTTFWSCRGRDPGPDAALNTNDDFPRTELVANVAGGQSVLLDFYNYGGDRLAGLPNGYIFRSVSVSSGTTEGVVVVNATACEVEQTAPCVGCPLVTGCREQFDQLHFLSCLADANGMGPLIHATADAVPTGQLATVAAQTDPDGDDRVLTGRQTDGRSGLWAGRDGALLKLAMVGEPAPGVADVAFDTFHTVLLGAAGRVGLVAETTGTFDGDELDGIWVSGRASLRLIAAEGMPAPGLTGHVFSQMALSFNNVGDESQVNMNNQGQLLFRAAVHRTSSPTLDQGAAFVQNALGELALVTAPGRRIRVDGVFRDVNRVMVGKGFSDAGRGLVKLTLQTVGDALYYVDAGAMPADAEAALPDRSAVGFDYAGESGDPVSTFTGELLDRPAPDLRLTGPIPLELRRTYASALQSDGPFGRNWRHGWQWSLVRQAGSPERARITRADGAVIGFRRDQDGWSLESSHASPYQLVDGPGGGLVLVDPLEGALYTFSAGDELTGISDGSNNALTLSYAGGRLTSVADGLGRSLTFSHDGDGHVTAVTDGVRTVRYTYLDGNLASFENAAGGVTSYSYQTAGTQLGLLVSTTLPRGNTRWTQEWDAEGRVSAQVDGLGNRHSYRYEGLVTTVSLPVGSTRYVHDGAGRLVSVGTTTLASDTSGRRSGVTASDEGSTSWTIDPRTGRVASTTFSDGATVSASLGSYSPMSGVSLPRVESMSFPDGTAESWAYDANGQPAAFTDRAGHVTQATFNAAGRPLTITGADGATTTRVWSTDGLLVSVTDAAGNTTSFTYDALGRRAGVTRADGATLTWTHDALDRITSVVDERGGTTLYAWDANGNLESVTTPDGARTSYAYDAMEQRVSITDPLGGVATIERDQANLEMVMTDASGVPTTLRLDGYGGVLGVMDALGNEHLRGYDGAGRLEYVSPPGTPYAEVVYEHDTRGHLTAIYDVHGGANQFTWDGMGRLLTSTDPLGRVTTWSRDARGQLVGVTLPDASATTITRDARGLLDSVTDATGAQWSFTWDALGRLTSRTDPLGRTTALTLDARHRVSRETFPDGSTVDFTHDASGRVVRRLGSDGTDLQYTYDVVGRRTGGTNVEIVRDAAGRVVGSNGLGITRDPAGRTLTMTLAPGKVVTYGYDARGLLTSVTDWIGGTVTYERDAGGRITGETRSNGVSTQFTYDARWSVDSIVETGPAGSLASTTLVRDAASQPTGATRVLPLAPSARSESTSTASFDGAGQLAGSTYDALGRVTQDGANRFEWDVLSRLETLQRGAVEVQFEHDAFGLPVRRAMGGGVDEYVWNYAAALPTIAVFRRHGADRRYVVHSPDGAILWTVEGDGTGRRFFHYDELGNTLFLTDDTGAVTDAYAYAPYGMLLEKTGTSDNPFTWQGRLGVMWEPGSALYHVRMRVYDARSGRFLTRDPRGMRLEPRGMNPYLYARANPLGYIDPTGQDATTSPRPGTRAESLGAVQEAADTASKIGPGALVAMEYGVTPGIKVGVAGLLDASHLGNVGPTVLDNGTRLNDVPGLGAGDFRGESLRNYVENLRLEESTRGASEAFDRMGKAADVLEVGLEVYNTWDAIDRIQQETSTLQEANAATMMALTDNVIALLRTKAITPQRADRMLADIRANLEAMQAAALQSGEAGILAAGLTGAKNLAQSLLLPDAYQMGLDVCLPEDPKF